MRLPVFTIGCARGGEFAFLEVVNKYHRAHFKLQLLSKNIRLRTSPKIDCI